MAAQARWRFCTLLRWGQVAAFYILPLMWPEVNTDKSMLAMPAYPLDLWTPSWKMRKVSARSVPRMLTDENKSSRVAVFQAMLSRDKGVNSALFSSTVTMDETWMPMFKPETKRQSSAQWKHTESPPPKTFRVTASAEKMMVAMFWDSEGVILTHCVPQEYNSDGWDLWRCVTKEVSSSAAWKTAPKRLNLCFFFIATTLLLIGWLVFTSFSTITTLKLFLMLGTHLTSHQAVFGCFQHWRTLFVVAHFQVVPILQRRFSGGRNEPLKKRLPRPCNRGVSVVKSVYVYRAITLRNKCIFSFLEWVIF